MDRLLDLFRPGQHIYLPGATGEILAIAQALAADPPRLAGVELTSCLLPGFNAFDYAALDPRTRLNTFLLPPALRATFATGGTRLIPLPYSAIARHIERNGFNVGVFHVASPDENSRCSLGIAADFALLCLAHRTVPRAVRQSAHARGVARASSRPGRSRSGLRDRIAVDHGERGQAQSCRRRGRALDFACGAMRSPGGRSILALQATARGGTISRIVPHLTTPTASLARDHVDTVVTEFGVAELHGKSLQARGEGLIAIAAPDHRDALEAQWRAMRATV